MSPSSMPVIVGEGQKALEELEKLDRSGGSDVEIWTAYFQFLGALSSDYNDYELLKRAAPIIRRQGLQRSIRFCLNNAKASLEADRSTYLAEKRKHPGRR